MGNYSLQKYKGTATRHTCPKCGDRHSFVYYVDENNVPLHPSVGRCNHESGCGYHYTPKEYFQEHPEHRTTNDFFYGTHALPISICVPVIRSNSRLYLVIRFSSNTFSSIPTLSGL